MDLSKYTGIRGDHGDPRVNAVVLENSTYSRSIYREGTVDYVFFDMAVALQKDTAEYLYSEHTPLEQPYAPGTRIYLENLTKRVLAGCESDRDKAVALVDWVKNLRNNYLTGYEHDAFHGGAEEEVIRKGSDMCNEMARVMIVMSQIAGIPSRYIGHMTPVDYDNPRSGTGHGVCELYVSGAWAYFDIRGRFFEKPDGRLATAWDLVSDPSLVETSPVGLRRHWDARSTVEGAMKLYAPGTAHIVVNYMVADHATCDYSWVYPSKSLWHEAREKARRIRTTLHRDLLPQPVVR